MSASKAKLAELPLSRFPKDREDLISLTEEEEPPKPLGAWIHEQLSKPAKRYLLQDLIAPGGLTVIAGRPKLGKSFVCLGALMAMSAGKAVGLLRPVGVSASVYLDLEGVPRETAARAEGLRLKLGLTREELDNVHMFTPHRFELLAPGCGDRLIGIIRGLGAQTLALDTFAASFNGDENAKKDVQKYINVLRYVRDETGCAIVLVHHVNKASFGYKQTAVMMDPDAGLRGSSALQGGYDTIISLQDGWIKGEFQTAMIIRGKYCGPWWAKFATVKGGKVHAEGLPPTDETLVTEFELQFGAKQEDYTLFEQGPTAEQPQFRYQKKGQDP